MNANAFRDSTASIGLSDSDNFDINQYSPIKISLTPHYGHDISTENQIFYLNKYKSVIC